MTYPFEYKWGEQRETCFKCKFFLAHTRTNTRGEYTVFMCKLQERKGRFGPYETCIKARDPGQYCGPEAKRFKPKQGKPYKP